MLDLVQMAVEADRLAEEARNARCCDALRPCRTCMARRRHVLARRLVILCPGRTLRPLHRTAPLAGYLTERVAC
jgi:hypothetical protein